MPAAGERGQELEAAPDDALVQRVRAGDAAAFRVLVERYQARVVAVVAGMLGETASVEDVAQETFIHFYETVDQFRGEAGVGTYLTRIAMNRSMDALRRRRRWFERFARREDAAEGARAEPSADLRAQIGTRERQVLVHRAIRQLSPKYRAVVVLRLIEGYSVRETAELLDLRYGTVLSRLSRARDRLRDLLGPYLTDGLDEPEKP